MTIRSLDDKVYRLLKERAARNHRSLEAEVRAILGDSVSSGGVEEFLAFSRRVRASNKVPSDFDAVAEIRAERARMRF
jgi:plasmid stability protein